MRYESVESSLRLHRGTVEKRLDELTRVEGTPLYAEVVDAMRYSLLDAGKRIRPALAMEFCKAAGGKYEDVLDCACAIEMIHTYSLIHDDLPCMDDDDMRRGRPSCHKKFGEATALLAGDALQSLSAQTIAQCKTLSADKLLRISGELARLSGFEGMIGGQMIDLDSEGKNEISFEILEAMDKGKTCALIESACVAGCIAAGAEESLIVAARSYAFELGMAFQIVDDILDVVGDEKKLGKPVASDAENNKSNYVSVLGLENAKLLAADHTKNAVDALAPFGENGKLLGELALYLCDRDY